MSAQNYIVYEYEDRMQRRATNQLNVKTFVAADGEEFPPTMPHINAFASVLAEAVDGLIGGIIRRATYVIVGDISGVTGNVASDSADVEEIGAFQFRTLDGLKVQANVPAIIETLVTNETGNINQAATAVAAYLAMMEDGIDLGGTLVRATDVGGDYLDATVYARERSRNSGKRRQY